MHTRRLRVQEFPRDDDALRSQAAELLVEAFPHENGCPRWRSRSRTSTRRSHPGVEVYPAPLEHLRQLCAPTSHPLGFYLRVGFVLSGLVPDANGRGLPGILLARRLG